MEKSFYIHYTCNKCEKEHVGPPSFAFDAPAYYSVLSPEDKAKSHLSADGCVILDNEFFVRVILEVSIIGTGKPFTWGVWVSQSEENFRFYDEHFKDDLTGRNTFGWFSNVLPGYDSTLGIKTTARFRGNGLRPFLSIENSKHLLSKDFHSGMSIEKATEIAGIMLHNSVRAN